MKKETGKLFIVATPIGNMGDITLRAIETLKKVDFIACEDTRKTGNLLKKLEISSRLVALHQHSRDKSIDKIIDNIKDNKNVAYVSDAGTPLISDPGLKLIQRVREISNPKLQETNNISNDKSQKNKDWIPGPPFAQGFGVAQQARDDKRGVIEIIPVPGPSAVATAISVSGLVNKEFYFVGFLPKKKGRQTKLKQLANIDAPIVIYENALRLERTLNDIEEYFGKDVEVFIAREMTKMFEEYFGGMIEEVVADLKNHKLKGEITLIVKKQ